VTKLVQEVVGGQSQAHKKKKHMTEGTLRSKRSKPARREKKNVGKRKRGLLKREGKDPGVSGERGGGTLSQKKKDSKRDLEKEEGPNKGKGVRGEAGTSF